MLGAIIGDIVGSVYEFSPIKTTNFPLFSPESEFTDDTICTVAIADAILHNRSYQESLLYWCHYYPSPKGGYGISFAQWLQSHDPQPYGSWGNGCAMRISPIAWAFDDLPTIFSEAQKATEITHNHRYSIHAVCAVTESIFMARNGATKADIRTIIGRRYKYMNAFDLGVDEIRKHYTFTESCERTVPEAITCFLESNDFVDAIRLAVSLGGDSDTLAAITGSIAGAFYGIPNDIKQKAYRYLDGDMQLLINDFEQKYGCERIF